MPLSAINEPSTRHETPDECVPVEVWVDDETVPQPMWCFGLLREWAHYASLGWTGFVGYSVGPAENRLGRFLAEHIRKLGEAPPPTPEPPLL